MHLLKFYFWLRGRLRYRTYKPQNDYRTGNWQCSRFKVISCRSGSLKWITRISGLDPFPELQKVKKSFEDTNGVKTSIECIFLLLMFFGIRNTATFYTELPVQSDGSRPRPIKM